MATESEMTSAREPGPGQAPVLVTRLGGQQRIFPVGAQVRVGTFLDGKQLNGPLRITESVVRRLGDPATGEELGVTPPLTSTQMARNHGRRVLGGRMRRGALVGALNGGLRASVLRHAESATVRLLVGSPTEATTGGSGTLISPTGLILTNTHVARPDTPGLAMAYVTRAYISGR